MNASDIQENNLSLPQNLTVRAITSVQQDVLQFIDNHPSAIFRFAEDCQVDLSFIQLVEAARIYAGTAGKSVALAEPAGGPLLETLQRSGFVDGMTAEDAKFWLHQGGIQ